MTGREEERVHHLIHGPTVRGDAAHRVSDRIAAVKEQRTPLEPREQILGQRVNHAAAGEGPGPGEYDLEQAVEGEQDQPPENHADQHPLRLNLDRKRVKPCLQPGGKRRLPKHMVREEGQGQRLQGRQPRRRDGQDENQNKEAPMRPRVFEEFLVLLHWLQFPTLS